MLSRNDALPVYEGVGDQHAVMQVQRLAVEVAAGLADFEELLDFGMRDVEIAGRRAAPQRALADRKREAVHHPHEGNDAADLAVEADRLADRSEEHTSELQSLMRISYAVF